MQCTGRWAQSVHAHMDCFRTLRAESIDLTSRCEKYDGVMAMSADPSGRFRAHKNYIEAFARLGGLTPSNGIAAALGALRTRVGSSLNDAPVANPDLAQIQRSLRNAWSTELLLALPGEWATDDEFLRLSNTWGVVQTYYVGYHATQALIGAKGMVRPEAHPATQNQYAALWADRPLQVGPWSLGRKSSGWQNIPEGVTIDASIHSWTSCTSQNCGSLAAKALDTTRRDAVAGAVERRRNEGQRARRQAWKAEEKTRLADGRKPRKEPEFARPLLSDAEKTAADRGVRTFTILDYLYRLRIGANYEDSAVFFDGPTEDHESSTVHRSLVFLAAGTLLLAEIRISQLVGESVVRQWATDFGASCLPADHKSIGVIGRQTLWQSADTPSAITRSGGGSGRSTGSRFEARRQA